MGDAAREREVAARDLATAHAQIDRLSIEMETIRQREAAAIERANAAAQRQWLSDQQNLLTTALRDREAAAAELVKVNRQKNEWLIQLQAASDRDRDANALLAEHTADIVAAAALSPHVAQPAASPIESGTASLVGDTEVSAGWVPVKIDVTEH